MDQIRKKNMVSFNYIPVMDISQGANCKVNTNGVCPFFMTSCDIGVDVCWLSEIVNLPVPVLLEPLYYYIDKEREEY